MAGKRGRRKTIRIRKPGAGRPRLFDSGPTPEVIAKRRRLAGDGDPAKTATPLDILETRGLITVAQSDAGRLFGWLRRRVYAANMDPGPREVERTPVDREVTYCLASSCHPALFDHVLDGGATVLVYHSACGYADHEVKAGFALDLGAGQQAIVLGEYELATTEGHRFAPVVVTNTSSKRLWSARMAKRR